MTPYDHMEHSIDPLEQPEDREGLEPMDPDDERDMIIDRETEWGGGEERE